MTSRPGRVIRKSLHVVLTVALVLALCAAPSIAQDDDDAPSSDMIALDLLFFRPVNLVSFLAGSAAFIATLPLPYIFGDTSVIDDARERAFTETASELFERPLGDL